jgi:thiamine transport system permease protein
VIIYQALKLDFDLPYATGLALVQLTICTILMFFLYKYNTPLFRPIFFKDKYFARPDSKKISTLLVDIIWIFTLIIITLTPIIALLINGFNNKFLAVLYSEELWNSAAQSLLIALCSGVTTLALAFGLTSGAFYIKYTLKKPQIIKYIMLISNVRLMVPAFVFSTGLFIILNNIMPINDIYFTLIIIMNSVAALPFATSIILPPSIEFQSQELYLCKSLNIKGLNFIKLIYWPRMRKSISYALALVITISWGDLGITALFNNNEMITLPYLLYNMMSSYYIEEAAVVALVILLSSFFLFWIVEELFSGEENAAT